MSDDGEPPGLLGAADVSRLLDEYGVRPSRHRGQNFLVDPNLVRRIVRLAGVGRGDRILEIGVGVGSLTAGLLGMGAHVLGLEIDPALEAAARSHLRGDLDLRLADATDVDWNALLVPDPTPPPGCTDVRAWKMVSNLPYSVGTRVLIDLLRDAPQIRSFLVMVQLEVGERLVAGPGDAAYGAVSVKAAHFCDAAFRGKVPPAVFRPRPDVSSVLVSLERRGFPDPDRTRALFTVLDAGFGQRRKTLRRALAARWDSESVRSSCAAAGIDSGRRAETLTLSEFRALADELIPPAA